MPRKQPPPAERPALAALQDALTDTLFREKKGAEAKAALLRRLA